MDTYIARQPIFDKNMKICAYELLYRSDAAKNYYVDIGDDKASANVAVDTFFSLDLNKLTNGKRVFINFTENLLKTEVVTLFPSNTLVIEVLETVTPDNTLYDSLRSIKDLGYTIALDDFTFSEDFEHIIELTDIIKVDFMASTDEQQRQIVSKYPKIKFLAEKIETKEEYDKAISYGYTYFQGYFFSKPVILHNKNISPHAMNYYRLIAKINKRNSGMEELAHIISTDIALSYRLLRMVNSAYFGFKQEITTIRHALTLLGMDEIHKWLSLMIMKGLGENKTEEIMVLSLTRAKLCEDLAIELGKKKCSDELFLIGLFSLIDVLMETSKEEVFQKLATSDDVKNALCYDCGPYYCIFKVVLLYEMGKWDELDEAIAALTSQPLDLSKIYYDAIQWSKTILHSF